MEDANIYKFMLPFTKQHWFSLNGRVTRLQYWVFVALLGIVIYLPQKIIFNAESEAAYNYETISLLLLLWPCIAIQVKRWHDRSKSGWWILINFIPVVGIWALIENGFLPGDNESNRYGDDPYQFLNNET